MLKNWIVLYINQCLKYDMFMQRTENFVVDESDEVWRWPCNCYTSHHIILSKQIFYSCPVERYMLYVTVANINLPITYLVVFQEDKCPAVQLVNFLICRLLLNKFFMNVFWDDHDKISSKPFWCVSWLIRTYFTFSDKRFPLRSICVVNLYQRLFKALEPFSAWLNSSKCYFIYTI